MTPVWSWMSLAWVNKRRRLCKCAHSKWEVMLDWSQPTQPDLHLPLECLFFLSSLICLWVSELRRCGHCGHWNWRDLGDDSPSASSVIIHLSGGRDSGAVSLQESDEDMTYLSQLSRKRQEKFSLGPLIDKLIRNKHSQTKLLLLIFEWAHSFDYTFRKPYCSLQTSAYRTMGSHHHSHHTEQYNTEHVPNTTDRWLTAGAQWKNS